MRGCLSAIKIAWTSLVVLLLFAVIAGPAIYLEARGAEASGVVTAKREEVSIRYRNYTHRQLVDVRYQPADAGEAEVVAIPVNTETYDRMRTGEAVEIRYLPDATLRMAPTWAKARLASQPPLGSLAASTGDKGLGLFVIVGGLVALVVAWSWTRSHWVAGAIGLWMLASLVYFATDGLERAPAPPLTQAQATVRDVTRIERMFRNRRRGLNTGGQPYQIVQLEFTPVGTADPVVAVDLVDEASVPGLEEGTRVAISYNARDPRGARIDGATRNYRWQAFEGLVLIALLAIVIGLIALWERRRRSRRRAPLPLP